MSVPVLQLVRMGRSAGRGERSEHTKKRKARPKVHVDEPVDQAGVVEAKAVDKPRLSLRADKDIACLKCGSQCTTKFCGECGAALGEQPVGFEGKSFDGMSEQEMTGQIKDSKSTGKEDGGVDLPGAHAAAGDGKQKQRQEPAEKTLTEADKKLLKAAGRCEEGKLQEAKDALNDGADVDAANKYGWTPLCRAAEGGHKEMVGMLIAGGADVDAVGKGGWTPLYIAVMKGYNEIAEMLIERGAGVDAATTEGKTPLDMSWEEDPSSPLTLLMISKSKSGIDSMTTRHLDAKLGAQLGKLIKNCDEGKKEDRQWLGTGVKTMSRYGSRGEEIWEGEEGLWVKGGDAVVGLVVRILSEGNRRWSCRSSRSCSSPLLLALNL